MFGLGLAGAYGNLTIEALGGASAALLVSLATRLLVGIAWYRMFQLAGKRGYLAFIPLVGPYTAFRLAWDDFSMAAIFSATTFVAWVNAVGVVHPVVGACAVINFILWWFMALLTSVVFQTNMILGFVYGGIPWAGGLLIALWPSASYKGPWSSDPEADQNLTSQERKKRRKKAAKEAKKQG
ncbi:MAG: hypothetical protein QM302_00710 [Acidobacteriota bacterium]|nr:hypothetical protein [Acidobacteriota bacterium]